MNKDNLLSELWRIAQKEDEELFFKYAAGDVLDEYIEPLQELRYYIIQLERQVEELESDLEKCELENGTFQYEKEQLQQELDTLKVQEDV